MDMLHKKIKFHAHKHQTLCLITSILFILLTGAMILDYYFTQLEINIHYQKVFEKQGLTELTLYHQGTEKLVNNYYQRSLSTIENMANEQILQENLVQGSFVNTQKFLVQQREINNTFTALYILDKSGKITTVSSDNPVNTKKFIGQNLAYRDYFKHVIQSQKSYTSNVLYAVNGVYTVVFSTPIFNAKKEIIYILNGATYLNDIGEKINIKSRLGNFYSVLIDTSGNIILDKDTIPRQVSNIKNTDRIAARIINSQQKDILDQEVNYKNEKVFVEASTISLSSGNNVYLLSYYPTSQFDEQLRLVKQELDRIFVGEGVREFAILIIAVFCIGFLIKRHDRNKNC